MRNLSWLAAAVIALAVMAYTPSDAKAQVFVTPTYGYNTAYYGSYYGYPAYGYGGYGYPAYGWGGSGITVATPGLAFSYGSYPRYYGSYYGGYGGYYGPRYAGYYGGGYRNWNGGYNRIGRWR